MPTKQYFRLKTGRADGPAVAMTIMLVSLMLSVYFSEQILLTDASSGSTSSSSSSPSYISVRALDKYGHSEQLQNALKAANLQGTLVVAARDSNTNSTIVLSLLDSSSSSPPSESTIKPAKVSKDPAMVRLLNKHNNVATAFISSSSTTTTENYHHHHAKMLQVQPAIVCTGLKSDATWLINKLQNYSHRVWERYNTFVDAPGVAYAVSKYMRKFWGYNEEEEYTPGLLLQDLKGRDTRGDEMERWSRPLGIVAMIISPTLPYIFVVEPSGVIQRYTAFAMGKNSASVLDKLPEIMEEQQIMTSSSSSSSTAKDDNKNEENGITDLQKQLIMVIKNTIVSPKKDMKILVEILSETGLNRTVVTVPR